mgnify:CR=1 FL=1
MSCHREPWATRPAGPMATPEGYGIVLQAKDDVKALFHCGPEYDVAFTHNSTAALNMVLKGLIHPGDGV